MHQFLESCTTFKYVSVDTEGNLLGISIATPVLQSMYFPIGHIQNVNVDEETKKLIYYTLETVSYRVMHHAGHDIVILPEIAELPFVCTMIMAHMVDENVLSKSLDYLHKHYCKGEGKKKHELMESIIKTMGWEYVPIELMNEYADNDALITMELFIKLLPLYEAQFGPLW